MPFVDLPLWLFYIIISSFHVIYYYKLYKTIIYKSIVTVSFLFLNINLESFISILLVLFFVYVLFSSYNFIYKNTLLILYILQGRCIFDQHPTLFYSWVCIITYISYYLFSIWSFLVVTFRNQGFLTTLSNFCFWDVSTHLSAKSYSFTIAPIYLMIPI